MGARISVAFKKGDKKSVALFSHWGGEEFADTAREYVSELKAERKGQMMPIDRLEPETVMVDFVRYLTKDLERVEGNLYLGKDASDGDNGDYGHHDIEL